MVLLESLRRTRRCKLPVYCLMQLTGILHDRVLLADICMQTYNHRVRLCIPYHTSWCWWQWQEHRNDEIDTRAIGTAILLSVVAINAQ